VRRPYLPEMFAVNLKSWRELRGGTQVALGDWSSIDPTVIAHYENGDRLPSIESLLRLCDALECSPNQLLTNTESSQICMSKQEYAYWRAKAVAFDKMDLIIDAVKEVHMGDYE
jgi:transcriptional regulator with XRE-family HTH domain